MNLDAIVIIILLSFIPLSLIGLLLYGFLENRYYEKLNKAWEDELESIGNPIWEDEPFEKKIIIKGDFEITEY